jgi:hypothetical protein
MRPRDPQFRGPFRELFLATSNKFVMTAFLSRQQKSGWAVLDLQLCRLSLGHWRTRIFCHAACGLQSPLQKIGRVRHVRPSVHGPNKMGEAQRPL